MQGMICENEVITDIKEVCNGVDDDCDGYVDEVDTDPASIGCNTTGVCAAKEWITVYCGIDKNFCDYSEVPDYEVEETMCDGLDNDCDGLVDEGLTYDGRRRLDPHQPDHRSRYRDRHTWSLRLRNQVLPSSHKSSCRCRSRR